MTAGLLAALAGTVGYGFGSVLQAVAAARASGPAVVRHPTFRLRYLVSYLVSRPTPTYGTSDRAASRNSRRASSAVRKRFCCSDLRSARTART